MKITLSKRIGLLAFLLPCTLALDTIVHARTNKLVAKSGSSVQSRQRTAMEREQWDGTRNLRQKVNKRTKREWDKVDAALDSRDKCKQNANTNAYQEPNTLRYLDRRAGRIITP